MNNDYGYRPSMSAESELDRLTAASINLIARRIEEGTASPSETTLFARLALPETRLKNEKTEHEIALMDAKKEALESQKHLDELFNDAIKAFRDYQPTQDQ
jgi:hypothetical protein